MITNLLSYEGDILKTEPRDLLFVDLIVLVTLTNVKLMLKMFVFPMTLSVPFDMNVLTISLGLLPLSRYDCIWSSLVSHY